MPHFSTAHHATPTYVTKDHDIPATHKTTLHSHTTHNHTTNDNTTRHSNIPAVVAVHCTKPQHIVTRLMTLVASEHTASLHSNKQQYTTEHHNQLQCKLPLSYYAIQHCIPPACNIFVLWHPSTSDSISDTRQYTLHSIVIRALYCLTSTPLHQTVPKGSKAPISRSPPPHCYTIS